MSVSQEFPSSWYVDAGTKKLFNKPLLVTSNKSPCTKDAQKKEKNRNEKELIERISEKTNMGTSSRTGRPVCFIYSNIISCKKLPLYFVYLQQAPELIKKNVKKPYLCINRTMACKYLNDRMSSKVHINFSTKKIYGE